VISIDIEEAAENVKAAYGLHDNPSHPGADWIPLAVIRAELEGINTREEQDAALTHLFLTGKYRLIAEVNRKALTAEDRNAAIHAGGEEKHLIRRCRK
jgi:hypothetical protein